LLSSKGAEIEDDWDEGGVERACGGFGTQLAEHAPTWKIA